VDKEFEYEDPRGAKRAAMALEQQQPDNSMRARLGLRAPTQAAAAAIAAMTSESQVGRGQE